MASFDFINLLTRYIVVNHLKSKSYTSRIQHWAKDLFVSHYIIILYQRLKIKGQFIDSKDKIKAEEGFLKSH